MELGWGVVEGVGGGGVQRAGGEVDKEEGTSLYRREVRILYCRGERGRMLIEVR